jgi:hypothetical protein
MINLYYNCDFNKLFFNISHPLLPLDKSRFCGIINFTNGFFGPLKRGVLEE